jgi:hypothetical protein
MTAAGHYHSHTPELAQAYRSRVEAAWAGTRERQRADMALAAAPPPHAAPVIASLSNGADRAQVLALPGTPGRGLDAYRANPIPVTGRSFAMLSVAPMRR